LDSAKTVLPPVIAKKFKILCKYQKVTQNTYSTVQYISHYDQHQLRWCYKVFTPFKWCYQYQKYIAPVTVFMFMSVSGKSAGVHHTALLLGISVFLLALQGFPAPFNICRKF
jgi:hypothetical protein